MAEINLEINEIFKGWSPSQYFGEPGNYNSSVAIDPDLPIVSTDVRTSGFPVPVGSVPLTTTNVTSTVIRQITHPKDNLMWTVQSNGRIVTFKSDLSGERLIGTVAGGNATWAEYYNNYIYVFGTGASKDDVSRIGPLNTVPYDAQTANFTAGLTVTGATSGATGIITADVDAGLTGTLTLSSINGHFIDNEVITDSLTGSALVNRISASLIVDNIWKGATLGSLTALVNTKYPSFRSVDMPNHVAHEHSDGSLYFCDFKNGQGFIHRINTIRVTNEGDTNGATAPSAYNALDLPFGFYPTAIESYGSDLMIIGIYQTDNTINQGKSAFIIWDPTNPVSFSIGPVPLSDPIASAILNINGTIYIWTGNSQNGVRISTYNGGSSVQELVYQEEGFPPFAGAVDALGNRIVWGGTATYPAVTACVWAYGSKNAKLPAGVHNVMKTQALSLADSNFIASYPIELSSFMNPVGNNGIGQSFTGNGESIVSCVFNINTTDYNTGNCVAKIFAHTNVYGLSSRPTGPALATSVQQNFTTIAAGSGLTTFIFNTPYQTVNGTKYVVMVERVDGGGDFWYVSVNTAETTHGGNTVLLEGTSSYINYPGDTYFAVYTTGASQGVTSLKYIQQNSNITPKVVSAWKSNTLSGIDQYSTTAVLNSKIRWMFNIGTKFEITRLSIPFAGAVSANTIITPTLYFDDLSSNVTLPLIDNSNYPSKRKVVYKGANLKNTVGFNNFVLEISYTGTDPLPVALPIKITIDVKEDEV